MSEFLRDIEKELQRERWQILWQQWQRQIIGGVIVAVLVGGGALGWQYQTTRNAEQASEAFDIAMILGGQNAEKAFHDLTEQSNGYATLAAFQEAFFLAKRGQWQNAVNIYDQLAAQRLLPKFLRELAQILAAQLLIDHKNYADIEKRLKPMIEEEAALRYSARELLAFSALSEKKYQQARHWLSGLARNPSVPQTMADRAQIMLDSISSKPDKPSKASKPSKSSKPSKPSKPPQPKK